MLQQTEKKVMPKEILVCMCVCRTENIWRIRKRQRYTKSWTKYVGLNFLVVRLCLCKHTIHILAVCMQVVRERARHTSTIIFWLCFSVDLFSTIDERHSTFTVHIIRFYILLSVCFPPFLILFVSFSFCLPAKRGSIRPETGTDCFALELALTMLFRLDVY